MLRSELGDLRPSEDGLSLALSVLQLLLERRLVEDEYNHGKALTSPQEPSHN